MSTIQALSVGPGTLVNIFGQSYKCRRVNYRNGQVDIHLQDKNEPLSPFVKNDLIVISVPETLQVSVEEQQ